MGRCGQGVHEILQGFVAVCGAACKSMALVVSSGVGNSHVVWHSEGTSCPSWKLDINQSC